MISILSFLLFIILTTLGIIHFNWVFGGEWGFEKTIPTKQNGERILNPKKIDSAVVGLALCSFGLFYLFKTSFLNFDIPVWITTYVSWIIPSIFILRESETLDTLAFSRK